MTINTLQEAIQFVESLKSNPELLQGSELGDFSTMVESAAINILQDKDNEYLAYMLSMVQAMAMTCILVDNPMLALKVMSNIEDFNEYALYVMKFVIGLSAMEELR